jgi:L-ascorbate metabolism protein UlaG (beta-lactamase superfamily)
MKIIKFEHACFVVEEGDKSLVVDPGAYTTDMEVPASVVAIVVTHEHADHMNKDLIKAITDKNPDAVIVGHQDVTSKLTEFKTQAVVPNEGIKIGNFELEFYGGQHASIASDMPGIANLGVMINERIYYPGDSFTVPDRPVEILALPVAAPWLKISETMEFLTAVKPQLAFPTHDAILSEIGKGLPDRMLPGIAQKVGAEYRRLQEPLEI